MTHSVTGDLFLVPPVVTDERWTKLLDSDKPVDEVFHGFLALLQEMSPGDRWRMFMSDAIAHAVFARVALEYSRGMILAQVDDHPCSTEAFKAAAVWSWNIGLSDELLDTTIEHLLIFGSAIACLDLVNQRVMCTTLRGCVLERGTHGRPVLVSLPDNERFGEARGEHVYLVRYDGDLTTLRKTLASMVTMMVTDALAVLNLDEEHYPRVGFLGHEKRVDENPIAWFPALEGLDERTTRPLDQRWISEPVQGVSLEREYVAALQDVSGVIRTDE